MDEYEYELLNMSFEEMNQIANGDDSEGETSEAENNTI